MEDEDDCVNLVYRYLPSLITLELTIGFVEGLGNMKEYQILQSEGRALDE